MVQWAKGVCLIHAVHRIHHLRRVSLEEWKDAGRERTAELAARIAGSEKIAVTGTLHPSQHPSRDSESEPHERGGEIAECKVPTVGTLR